MIRHTQLVKQDVGIAVVLDVVLLQRRDQTVVVAVPVEQQLVLGVGRVIDVGDVVSRRRALPISVPMKLRHFIATIVQMVPVGLPHSVMLD